MSGTSADAAADAAVDAAAARMRGGDRFVRCDLGSVVGGGLDLVDRLARLRLEARRRGCRLEIRTADEHLVGLLELAGLDDVVLLER